ncbi:MAG: sodium:calcium antiporter [Ferruginibacter sp.]
MHLENLSLTLLLGIFIASGVVIWIAGIHLSKTTSKLSTHFGLSSALGGLIILALVTNLPEIAIVVSASLQGNTEIAVGNILGGIAMQTVVLVVLDVFGTNKKSNLTRESVSLTIALEGILVIAILALVVLGSQLPSSLIFDRVTPAPLLIAATWVIGLRLLSKAEKNIPWKLVDSNGIIKVPKSENEKETNAGKQHIGKIMLIFFVAALFTLIAGVALERSGNAISKDIGMQGILFGATIMAAATSLPEVSTGLTSMKLKQYELAVSDIFGGNAFLPVLFLLATLLSGKAILPAAQKTDIYLTALAMLLTTVYTCGIIFRTKKKIIGMGLDSFVVLILYCVGVVGLFVI